MRQLLFFLLLVFFSACSKKDGVPQPEVLDHLEAKTIKDAIYGTDPKQKMDVYLPANRTLALTKVMVLIHGGAWVDGDKGDFNLFINEFHKYFPDYAIFNLNYRLLTAAGNRFPAQEEDIRKAVDFIYSNRDKYVISDQWVIGGISAGAHLALLQGYKNSSPIRPKALVDFFGPVDMVALYKYYEQTDASMAWALSLLLSGKPTTNANLYASSSPINYVNAQSPPTLIFQGGLDELVPKAQSYELEAKLKSGNVKTKLVYYAHQTHGWSDPVIIEDNFKEMVAFLKANLP